MRWSQMFVPTLRDDPAEADAPSHRLLLRAGYVRQLTAGHYSLLPLAVRVRARIIEIIRAEMDAIGAQEMLLPALHPAEPWQRSGRWELMGQEMFRLRDRRGADHALGMTHEEIFATVARELNSYRRLPQQWYQFQTKFRDEPRPKGGLMRTREFTMKDAYSFDLDGAGLDASFGAYHGAYTRIFERLGLPALACEASSGTMGGSDSTEFMCPADVGEDLVVHCPACGYAANIERATSVLPAASDAPGPAAPERFDTPGVRTIEDLRAYDAPDDRQIKTLVYVLDGTLTLVLLRGDHPLNEQKLVDATGATGIRAADPAEIQDALGALPGSLGAVDAFLPTPLPVIADEALRGRRDMFTGANTDDVHLRGVDVDRDIEVGKWADLREVEAGQRCVRCGEALEIRRAIEVGHIFKLGDRYARALGVEVLDPDGKRVPVVMGSYGIGVERAMAAIIEIHNDDRGIVWPLAVAPFQVTVVVAQSDDAEVAEAAEDVYAALKGAGVDVVIDDRAERAGVKFRDAELTGIPFRVTVGRRGLAEGTAEVTARATGDTEKVPLDAVVAHVRSLLRR
ncbi:proline--tRNA ligase [Actinomadura livida]|uniref:Proline--tRNA ligase n=1 Tax=Actinomadura livida TaxID=79909 RepID=A0A7W7N175_9ACTN|nr:MULTISPECIES: proline--tRNA ligase [Actinomadura]MBB4777874.1 prolyl-tRNA synthetase [Actinomadura catellatispora]GGT98082.1 proline--tRNA ligase [Actinomadura livida]